MRFVVELDGRRVQAALTLDPHVVRAVDHDLGHAVVGDQALERPVSEDVVCELRGQPLVVVLRDARLLCQMRADLLCHPLA